MPPDCALPPITEDSLFGGTVSLCQPARGFGYRANADAILLAAFSVGRGAKRTRAVVDLGAGVGAVTLALAHFGSFERAVLVERRRDLAALAERNLSANGHAERARVLCAELGDDFESIAPELARSADLVVANPPFVTPGRDGTRALRSGGSDPRVQARRGSVEPFVRAAAHLLGRRGRACFVYPSHALLELLALARGSALLPKRMRFVHGTPDRPARIALIELVRGREGGLVVLPPLVETDGHGAPSAELADLVLARPASEQSIENDRAGGANAQMVVPAGADAADGREKMAR